MKARFPEYDSYDSGKVAWADLLPTTWEAVRLRWACSIYSGGTPSKNTVAFWHNGTIPWLNSGTVNQRSIRQASTFITQAALSSSSAKWIPRKALVVALAGQGKTKGMVAQLEIRATCNQSMAAIVPSTKLVDRFLFWWLRSNYENIRNMSGGDLRDGLNLKLLGDIECPLPSHTEQTQIAKFLDYETAKIDALIEKQQQLIALLKEKRQAVISHAVTKGLNPDAPMRDSGVEWLGEVPADWKCVRLRRVGEVDQGRAFAHAIQGQASGELPWFKVKDMNRRGNEVDMVAADNYVSRELATEIGAPVFPVGTVIFPRVGAALLTNKRRVLSCPAVVDDNIYGFRPERVHPRFLYLALLLIDMASLCSPGLVPTVTFSAIKDLSIPLPSITEQELIVDYVESKLRGFDGLVVRLDEVITLLQERRAALISAAVTGKIDVRRWQAPQPDAEAA